MKNISLLPAELRQYHKYSKRRNTVIIAGLCTLLVFVLIYMALSFSMLKTEDGLMSMQQRKAQIQAEIASLKQYEDKLSSARSKETLIVSAMGNNPQWDVLFTEIFSSMPYDVWLTSFNADNGKVGSETGEAGGMLTIDGQALDMNSLAQWLSRLQEVKGLGDVKCGNTSVDGSTGTKLIKFQITAVILQGEGFKIPADGGVKN